MEEDNCEDTNLTCDGCLKIYVSKSTLTKHINKGRCRGTAIKVPETINKELSVDSPDLRQLVGNMCKEMELMRKQLSIIQAPCISNQNLNVICFGKDDDLLDILTRKTSKKEALTFIKNCAFTRLAGDCRLLQRVYFPPETKPAILYQDKRKTRFIYYDERSRQIVEKDKNEMGKKLGNILRNCYLKTSECLKNPETGRFLDVGLHHFELPQSDESDRQEWEQTIYRFSDVNYLLKIIRHLTIPCESDFD